MTQLLGGGRRIVTACLGLALAALACNISTGIEPTPRPTIHAPPTSGV